MYNVKSGLHFCNWFHVILPWTWLIEYSEYREPFQFEYISLKIGFYYLFSVIVLDASLNPVILPQAPNTD